MREIQLRAGWLADGRELASSHDWAGGEEESSRGYSLFTVLFYSGKEKGTWEMGLPV